MSPPLPLGSSQRARSAAADVPAFGSRSSQSTSGVYSAGERLADRYRLVELLGHGGMGVVWLAYDERVDGAEVAIKLMAKGAGPEAEGRLLQEAEAAARLGHESIVRVLDVGFSASGEPFLVMERLEGESLRSHLAREGRVPATQGVQMLLPIASALAATHASGILHRDLKPDNVVLARTSSGGTRPTLVDFGVAKLRTAELAPRVVTTSGLAVGSPEYMAPEQVHGKSELDERVDVWALCVVLYEAVTGRRPFDDPNYVALLNAIVHDEPLPITRFAAGDAALWAILASGLSKSRDARQPSMMALGTELARWALSHGIERDITGAVIAERWPVDAPPGSSARASLSSLSADATGDAPALPSVPPPPCAEPTSSSSSRAAAHRAARSRIWFGLALCAIVGLALGALLPRWLRSPDAPASTGVLQEATISLSP